MDKKKYQNYKAEDFLLDEPFRNWVLQPYKEIHADWNDWLKANEHKRSEVEIARALLLSIEKAHGKEKLNRFEKVALLNEIQTAIAEERKPIFTAEKTVKIKKIKNPSWFKSAIAVAFFLFALAAFWMWTWQVEEVLYATKYGETKTVLLPDSSLVILNANSTLRLTKSWREGTIREVWLSGEAFFEVQKKAETKAKFIVHTEDLDVEVLGTQFNVRKRKDATKVVLQEGEIRLELHSESQEKFLMEPGDMISYSAKSDKIEQTKVKPEIYSSWKDNELIFENLPLEEVVTIIEEIFGLEVIFKNTEKKKKKIQLTVPSTDVSILFESLLTLYEDIKINTEGKRIEIY